MGGALLLLLPMTDVSTCALPPTSRALPSLSSATAVAIAALRCFITVCFCCSKHSIQQAKVQLLLCLFLVTKIEMSEEKDDARNS
jgi:hypothetical protein